MSNISHLDGLAKEIMFALIREGLEASDAVVQAWKAVELFALEGKTPPPEDAFQRALARQKELEPGLKLARELVAGLRQRRLDLAAELTERNSHSAAERQESGARLLAEVDEVLAKATEGEG